MTEPRVSRGGWRSRAAGLAGRFARTVGLGTLALGAFVVSSCFTSSDGLEPPTDVAYYPTALTISTGRTALYVANSDFDLQYNGGTVQALDLAGDSGLRTLARTIAETIDAKGAETNPTEVCASIGSVPNTEAFAHPGPCAPLKISQFLKKVATIGAFASQAVMVDRTDGQPGSRLFVTVRGDPSVTYFDVVDDRDPSAPVSPCSDPAFCLECAGGGEGKRCGTSHLVGSNPFDNLRGLKMPTEPTGIDVFPLGSGDPMVIANQASAQASLVVNSWPGASPSGPALQYFIGGLPDGPINVVHIPAPKYVSAKNGDLSYRPGFIVSHRAAAELTVLRYEDDAESQPARPFLTKTADVPITLSATGNDSRGMAIDSTKRDACESECFTPQADGTQKPDFDCLEGCLDVPLDLYVLSRAPSSLMIGRIDAKAEKTNGAVSGIDEIVTLSDVLSIPSGASGLSVGHVVDESGQLATRIFAVSFDSRYISVYDPATHDKEKSIKTGRGPYGMAFDTSTDPPEAYLYVGHFTDSYIGVVDLDRRRTTYGEILLSVGPPKPPKGESDTTTY